MTSLITNKLSRLPIGTCVGITFADEAESLKKVSGILTDNDFFENAEITGPGGEETIVGYARVRGIQVTKSLSALLKELPAGTRIRYSHGSEADRQPCVTGTVVENDGEESVEIRTVSGEEDILNYSMVRSLLVLAGPGTASSANHTKQTTGVSVIRNTRKEQRTVTVREETPLYAKIPMDLLNAGDNRLRELFEHMSADERRKLGGYYDRFKYGVKTNDRNKMKEAAEQTRQTLFREYDDDYDWSDEAILFCGHLLRRVGIYDREVFLLGGFYKEAAYACWKDGRYPMASAYAVLALLKKDEKDIEDLAVILCAGIVGADDASGLRAFSQRVNPRLEPHLRTVIRQALGYKDCRVSESHDIPASLFLLETLYPGQEMADEVDYWLAQDADLQEAPEAPVMVPAQGIITRLNWSEHSGTITGDDGSVYTFDYDDITDQKLEKTIRSCLRADLGGSLHPVRFQAEGQTARMILADEAYVDRARAIAAIASREDRFETAFELCRCALETPDASRALGDLVKHAITLHAATGQTSWIETAVELYTRHSTVYPDTAFAAIDMARCYECLKAYPLMLEQAEKAVSFSGLAVRQRIAVLAAYLRMLRDYHGICGNKQLLTRMLEQIDGLKDSCRSDPEADQQVKDLFASVIMPYRVIAACGMDMLEAAEEAYAGVPASAIKKFALKDLMEKTRSRLAPSEAPPQEEENTGDVTAVRPDPQFVLPVMRTGNSADEDAEGEECEPAVPYADSDGWDALELTKQDVIDYALHITGSERIPAILAYLHAGAQLNPEIMPVYRMAALAANDPMEKPVYSLTALVRAMEQMDPDYPALNDCCLAAAFLRTAFRADGGYDYTAQSLGDSIDAGRLIPSLALAWDTMAQFRRETGCPMDAYADYRSSQEKQHREALLEARRYADELYTKFILTPAREGVKFARLLETKKIAFARDGYLATMLRYIIEDHPAELAGEKDNFIAAYLSGNPRFDAGHISSKAIDSLIDECWMQAGRSMQHKRLNATLQGDRRNNLRSNISEILGIICRWYGLCEQDTGLAVKTEQGEQAYQILRPRLLEQLAAVSADCLAEAERNLGAQLRTGLFLVAAAARELSARLDGTWEPGKEKYLYVDFLRSGSVLLNEDFMPDLSATFCALPAFNILARIRRHVEEPKPSFREQIRRIFGADRFCRNYGTAARIMEYLADIGEGEAAALPDNTEQFIIRSEMQTDLRFREFRNLCALARNRGQIAGSDTFCHTLEDTARYWYCVCADSKNYGFFTEFLFHAEKQIHTGARQYEAQLYGQLDALIDGNSQYFDTHPGYAEAVRGQIAGQNFTAAEDWMARMRIDDFSAEVLRPEALGYLEQFGRDYARTYEKVCNADRPLTSLLVRREAYSGGQLIDNWLRSGSTSDPEGIGRLLNLLGWENILVSRCRYDADPGTELYEVRRAPGAVGMTAPRHPIAAYGSALDEKPMYIACLYGIYDSSRLCEKLRMLDMIDGSKIILLDCALSQVERRILAQQLKKRENGLHGVNLIIDRVLITFLAENYDADRISRILMATAMPFSCCQPYGADDGEQLKPLRTAEAQELLTLPLSYLGFSFPDQATVSQILATCSYNPGLIRCYARKLIESVRAADYAGYDIKRTPPYLVSDEHLSRVVSDKDFIRRIRENLKRNLMADRDGCRYPLALLIGWMYHVAPCAGGYTAADILHHAADLSIRQLTALDPQQIGALVRELQELNILRSVSDNTCLLASSQIRDLLGSGEEILEKLMDLRDTAA